MKCSKLMMAAVLAFGLLGSNSYAAAPEKNRSYKTSHEIFNGIKDVRPGERAWFDLGRVEHIHSLQFQVEAVGSHDAGAAVSVNGDKKGDLFAPGRTDPFLTVTVEAKGQWVLVNGYAFPNQNGTLRIRKVIAYIYPKAPKPVPVPVPDRGIPNLDLCHSCSSLPFDTFHYRTRLGAIANRVIILVDRLDGYTDYASFGQYLLPIKKSAAMARARAETYGDASRSSRVYYENLLSCLDAAEAYLSNMYERNAAFDLATELLGMREHLRDTLD